MRDDRELSDSFSPVEQTDATRARIVDNTVEISSQTQRTHRLVRIFRLHVTDGPDAGEVMDSSSDRVTIGTLESNELVLHDRSVSRFHCVIDSPSGRPLLKDLDSLNGTTVDGVPVMSAYLMDGARVVIGRSTLRVELGQNHVRIPLSEKEQFGSLTGRSAPMRQAFALLERAASSDATVLMEGETGTGKEAAAESIHLESPRRDGPFIVVDCGAIPPNLIESELFGHARGAFTGATGARQGAFEAASGGTVFLDEVGELGLDLQPKLLRALERREIKRVGETKYFPIDVRVIAATNRNLRAEVNAQRFRSDLYYRLAVLQIRMPPLGERPEDLPLLVEHLLTSLRASEEQSAPLRLPEFEAQLARHSWPGNVRELRNYLERCLALREQPSPCEFQEEDGVSRRGIQPIKLARDAFDKQYLKHLLDAHRKNMAEAARVAGVDRATLYRLLWRHGLR